MMKTEIHMTMVPMAIGMKMMMIAGGGNHCWLQNFSRYFNHQPYQSDSFFQFTL